MGLEVVGEQRRVEAGPERQLLAQHAARRQPLDRGADLIARARTRSLWCGQLSCDTAISSRPSIAAVAPAAPQPTAANTTSGTSRLPGRSAATNASASPAGIISLATMPVHSPMLWPAMTSGWTPSRASAAPAQPAQREHAEALALEVAGRAAAVGQERGERRRDPDADQPGDAGGVVREADLDAGEEERDLPAAGGQAARA